MVTDQRPPTAADPTTRRRFLSLAVATGAAGVAGCYDRAPTRNESADAAGDGRENASAAATDGTGEATHGLRVEPVEDVVAGDPVTVEVSVRGDPVENATVSVGGESVGTTDGDGRVVVEVPHLPGEVDVRVEHPDHDPVVERITAPLYGRTAGWFSAIQHAVPPAEYDWNPFAGGPVPDDRYGLFAQWTQYLVGEDRFYPHLVREWQHGDGEVVLRLAETFTWGRTGEPVTAEDLAFQLSVYDAAGDPAARYVEDATATGEFELTVSYPPGTNRELVEYTLLPLLADVPPDDWAEADREGDPARVPVPEPDASGALALTDRNDAYARTEVRLGLDGIADHPVATHYNWDGYRLEYRESLNAAHQSFIAGEVDGQHSLLVFSDVREQLPDAVREVRFPAGSGLALWFNHDREPWDRREARKALLYSIDRSAVVSGLGGTPKIEHPVPTGLSAASTERWLGSDPPEGFTAYGRDHERAAELMAEVGVTPEDVSLAVTYSTTPADWATATFDAVDQLRAAGWDAAHSTVQGSIEAVARDGDFDVLAYPWSPGRTARSYHPYFPLAFQLRGFHDADGHFANYDPGTATVDGEPVDVAAELDRLASTSPRADQERIVRRLARVVNEDLPCAILMEHAEQSLVNTARFDVPAESPHLRSRWPQWWLPKVEERLPGADVHGLMKFTGG